MDICSAARDFFVRQGALTKEYFVYFDTAHAKRAACRTLFLLSPAGKHNAVMAVKSPPIGRVDIFQTRPSIKRYVQDSGPYAAEKQGGG